MQQSQKIRFFLHVGFWLFVALFYYSLFSWNSDTREVSLIISTGLLPVAIGVTYFFNYHLVPKYLWEKRYTRFFLFSFYTLLVATWFSFLLVFFALLYVLTQKLYIDPSVLHPEWQVITLNFIVFFAIAVKQVKRSFFAQQEKNQLEKTKLATELKLREAELKLLKAQVHPHFLFNTLNNLYGLTLEKSNDAPELVLRLSEILDYILYRCNKKEVLLSEEIKNLKNYIAIEKIRYPARLKLSMDFPKETDKLKIAPLLLLPFAENAFKHGVSQLEDSSFITLHLSLNNNKLNFRIINSKIPDKKNSGDSSGGIGLKNVKKRLELLYPGRFNLDIADSSETYSVNLLLVL